MNTSSRPSNQGPEMDCKNARETLGLTQTAIGEFVSKNKSQIYKIESGRLKVPGSYLVFCQIVWRLSLESDFEGVLKPHLIANMEKLADSDRNYHSIEMVAITCCLTKNRFSVLNDVLGVRISEDALARNVKGTSMDAALKSVETFVNSTLREHAKSRTEKSRKSWEDALLSGSEFIQKIRIALDREEGESQ